MTPPDIDQLFDRRIVLPDADVRARLSRLVGLDEVIVRLTKLLGVLISPQRLNQWMKKYHPGAATILTHAKRRHPLVILSGDVGTGKTELAETIGDKVARNEKIEITLFPMSLSTRGSGLVGEMSRLISESFSCIEEECAKIARKKDGGYAAGSLLLIDEADALSQSRENAQMHHEDRAGVNALIRGIDLINQREIPAAIIMCTNRLSAIDPAVQRRAAEIFDFARPNDAQRHAIISPAFKEIGFTDSEIQRLVDMTGATAGRPGFTFSDLTQRFMNAVVMDAYPDKAIDFERAVATLGDIHPTPPFGKHNA